MATEVLPEGDPRGAMAEEAVDAIVIAADHIRCAAQALDRLPSFFQPDVHEVEGSSAVTLGLAAGLLQAAQRINAARLAPRAAA